LITSTSASLASEQFAADLPTIRHVLSVFVPLASSATIQSVRGGLSGSAVFVCEVGGRKFAMKRWPAGTAARRIDEVHDVMAQARRSLTIVPELVRSSLASTRVGYEGFHYELVSWMDGEAITQSVNELPQTLAIPSDGDDGPAGPALRILAVVEAGGEAIARFHDSVRRISGPMTPAPSVLRRLGRIEQLRVELPQAIKRADALSPVLRGAAKWLERESASRFDAAHRVLGQWVGRMVPTQMVLRDVHRQHILFRDGAVTGLVDFDAIGVDSIATDLARWVSDFAEQPTDLAVLMAIAVAGYRRFAPISACESELASAISEASAIILLANWVVWTALDQQNFSGSNDLVDRRVIALLRRMGATGTMAMAR
jgi:hypothetical protein